MEIARDRVTVREGFGSYLVGWDEAEFFTPEAYTQGN
jgi:hypothetical protein